MTDQPIPLDTEARGCSCGHKMEFCHKVNAVKWCGGASFTDAETEWMKAHGWLPEIAVQGIIERAEKAEAALDSSQARAEEAEARLRSALETRAVWQANYGLERTRADTSEQERDHATQEVERLRAAADVAIAAMSSMPDAGLSSDDPRYDWWFNVLVPARDGLTRALNPNPTPEDEDG